MQPLSWATYLLYFLYVYQVFFLDILWIFMGYAFSDKIITPHQLCRYKVFEKYFPEWGFYGSANSAIVSFTNASVIIFRPLAAALIRQAVATLLT